MVKHRPLIQHIRNHDALFTELALIRNEHAQHLGLNKHDYHKTPKFITPDGQRLTIEPERSIVLRDYKALGGVKELLAQHISGLHIVPHSEIGFRYPTAAIAGSDAPFIKRFRSEFFHKEGEDHNICRPRNLSYGIKSRGKGDNRQEYEVWVANEILDQDPSPLFIDKYGEDLPQKVREFAALAPVVHGWMGVKRAAFEAIYCDVPALGDIAINLGLSVDAYNIGARPDLAYAPQLGSSIAAGNAELEWEVMGYYAPKGWVFDHEQIWQAINASILAIANPMEDIYHNRTIATFESKTERILSSIQTQGISPQEISHWNLKPWEFLQTSSHHRKKSSDPSRSVNLLGRLNRLFYHPSRKLPALKELHDLIAQPASKSK